jgi:hypothetical protein
LIFEPYKNSKESFIPKENSQVAKKLKLCTDYEKIYMLISWNFTRKNTLLPALKGNN